MITDEDYLDDKGEIKDIKKYIEWLSKLSEIELSRYSDATLKDNGGECRKNLYIGNKLVRRCRRI
jgi:Mor family transcriptional regulator